MSKRSYVKNESGTIVAIRETSDSGRRSELYEADNSVVGQIFSGGKGSCTEVADHHSDGKTDAYEPDNSLLGAFLNGGKGKHK